MDTPTGQLDLLMDLEARHEDLLRQLSELDQRVEKALAECQVYRTGAPMSPLALVEG
jgi:hypothetical protein